MPSEATPAAISGEEILSVSALNRLARQALEQRFPLLWVSGEISNLRRPASGHVYFALKDENAQVDCVMFRNRSQLVPFRLQDGLRVEARALVTLYEARGGFQLGIETLRQAGIGALFEAFARLREKLEKEGLFAAERRLPLPRFPRRIGIVTSLQAAALRDVLAALERRARHLPVAIYPTLVQGEGAAAGIADAIRTAAERGECDLLIVARGGGSIEDLWAFNEEIVARAIDACPIPIVSGIGHETDTTIADLVADCRAATPTAAAELASAGWFEAQAELRRLANELRHHMQRRLQERMQRVDLLARRLSHPGERLGRLRAETAHLASRLGSSLRQKIVACRTDMQGLETRLAVRRPDIRHAQRDLDELAGRVRAAAAVGLTQHRHRLQSLAASLGHLSPQAVLARGFSLVRKSDGSIVRSSAQLDDGDRLRLTFGEGEAEAQVTRRDSLNT
ncbi:MAG: exodeoxyribonuclease VII large subunit [Rhodocyclaceae bacterium]|jgi:exodeoxyribonuclease VII large subunit|nr:Exodeoxyribonuclease 7 large subunit [Rhodocyclaceae bacterium]MCC6879575.1 exodeoxyribonuclease VII large subunit [Rhodocyclaceae bacterium]MCL4679793.1 exodeoxyribonuclease VII large subunit [Rhodocyclaceae bacterium]